MAKASATSTTRKATAAAAKESKRLTADQDSKEHEFLQTFLESALAGDLTKLEKAVLDYSKKQSLKISDIFLQYKDGQKRSALHFACQSKEMNRVKMQKLVQLINKDDDDDDDNKGDKDDNAESADKSSTIQILLKQKDKFGLTPLMLVAQQPQYAEERIAFLLELGGNHLALARSQAGGAALHYAAGAGASASTIQRLLGAAPIALETNSLKGGTPLHWVASLQGADYTGTTMSALLEGAAAQAKKEKLLNMTNSHGLTALAMAMAAGNDIHSKFLVQQGAAIDVELPEKVTLFHIAADCNLVQSLALLLEKYNNDTAAADPTMLENEHGQTPLDLAILGEHLACVMLLTGEMDETKARQYMMKEKVKRKDKAAPTRPTTTTTTSTQESTPKEKKKEEVHPTEKASQELATGYLRNPPSVSAEDEKKALELKQQGNDAFGRKDWLQAIECYSEAIALFPTEATLYSNRCACYLQQPQPQQQQQQQQQQHEKEALQDAVMCRVLRPDWPKAYYRLATVRLALKRYEDAAYAAWEGLELDHDNDELQSLLRKAVKRGRQAHLQREKEQNQQL